MTLTAFSFAYCAKTDGLIGTTFGMVKVSNGIIHPMALDMSPTLSVASNNTKVTKMAGERHVPLLGQHLFCIDIVNVLYRG